MRNRSRRVIIDSDILQFEERPIIEGLIPPVLIPPVVVAPKQFKAPPVAINNEPKSAAKETAKEVQEQSDEGNRISSFFEQKKAPFVVSLVTHVIVLVVLALIPIISQLTTHLTIVSLPEPESFDVHNIAFNDEMNIEIGANSIGTMDMALSSAPVLSDLSETVAPSIDSVIPATTKDSIPQISDNIQKAVGITQSNLVVRGMTGFGTTGTEGAVDRITYEIIKSIEERPTLVVWMFDASISLSQRRTEIVNRFDKVYNEIGLVTAQQAKQGINYKVEPLLTSVYSFGNDVRTQISPTADVPKIKNAVNNIKIDSSGIEMVFTAITMAANEFQSLRAQRNIMIIVVTDERGNDIPQMDRAIEICKYHKIPVYILGVPAPFGRTFTYMKYVNPEGRKDQLPGWGQIDQGPETFGPECVHFTYNAQGHEFERFSMDQRFNMYEDPAIDSGFGAYSLCRIVYETGGIFFTIHPNRIYDRDVQKSTTAAFAAHLQRFFDPSIMERYRPDYLSGSAYQKMLDEHPLRAALVKASESAESEMLEPPKTRFIKHESFNFEREVDAAQRVSTQLGKHLEDISDTLNDALPARYSEFTPRWLASYDLSRATANAERIRNQIYGDMLDKVKGMNFQYPENNTWLLEPSSNVTGDDKLIKEAHVVLDTFEHIIEEHKGTPWAYLAQQEIRRGLGWRWEEMSITIRREERPSGGNRPMPRDDRPPPTMQPTPVPKL